MPPRLFPFSVLLLSSFIIFSTAQSSTSTSSAQPTTLYTTTGTTFLASTRASTSSATSTAMASLSTTSSITSTTSEAQTTATAASATSLSVSNTAAAQSLSVSSRTSTTIASSTTYVQSTSAASFIASTSSIASLSASVASSTSAATSVASTTGSFLPSHTPLICLEVVFRAPCINSASFVSASKIPNTYVLDYDGCKDSSEARSMLLVAADLEGVEAQSDTLKRSQLYFGNQSAVSFTKFVTLTSSGPIDTEYPDSPTGPPIKYSGPSTTVIILLVIIGGVLVVSVGVGIMACVTRREIAKGYSPVDAKSAPQL